ncbi:MAG: hypothetical protein ACOYKZ_06475 [Chlamydiia bacterium]
MIAARWFFTVLVGLVAYEGSVAFARVPSPSPRRSATALAPPAVATSATPSSEMCEIAVEQLSLYLKYSPGPTAPSSETMCNVWSKNCVVGPYGAIVLCGKPFYTVPASTNITFPGYCGVPAAVPNDGSAVSVGVPVVEVLQWCENFYGCALGNSTSTWQESCGGLVYGNGLYISQGNYAQIIQNLEAADATQQLESGPAVLIPNLSQPAEYGPY